MADFVSKLRRAIMIAEGAGLRESALELEGRAFAAYTTSSEWLGETGEAIQDFLVREAGRVPAEAAVLLDDCRVEIGKVWPKYRPE